ncbi:MAG: hypothetical protein IT208_15875 [Chthonomonadales bacterium]|nr:hypothetical protein [Chthonomonadales bacterium]
MTSRVLFACAGALAMAPAANAAGYGQQPLRRRERPITVRVLAACLNPVMPDGRRLHETMGWSSPLSLASSFAEGVAQASGGFIRYRVVQWRDVPPQGGTAGRTVTSADYAQAVRAGSLGVTEPALEPEQLANSPWVLSRLERGDIDEVWVFTGPSTRAPGARTPGAFCSRAAEGPTAGDRRDVPVMSFSYERGVAEMLHVLGHRVERAMSAVYGGWRPDDVRTNWARFAASYFQSHGVAAVGTCDRPPNAERDFDYSSPRVVYSGADDWLSYPQLTGTGKPVSCESWGGPDYHGNYIRWWLSHLPRVTGQGADGRLLNWWRYVFEPDRLAEFAPKERSVARR